MCVADGVYAQLREMGGQKNYYSLLWTLTSIGPIICPPASTPLSYTGRVTPLKVVYNEKQEGSESWKSLGINLGHRRSYVCLFFNFDIVVTSA